MICGYVGNILHVDLSKMRTRSKPLDEGLARKYIGGSGLAAHFIWDETTGETEPLSPENPLVFMSGPLTGLVPSSGRWIVAAISPKTNIWGESHAGGKWGDELKYAGFDGIIIRGKASKPTYLWVNEGKAELRNARRIWGKDNYDVDPILREETNKSAIVASIGPAGERLARISCIMSGGKEGRAAARSGLGAVMGHKKLKAVVVRGTRKPKVYDEERLRKSVEANFPKSVNLMERRQKVVQQFTDGHKEGGASSGFYPIKNWLEGKFEGFNGKMAELMLKGRPYLCRTCRNGCVESAMVESGRHAVYEAITLVGSSCMVDDMDAIEQAYTLCNRLGLDAISTGAVIAFAMECYEKGIISKKDTNGLALTWGNAEAMVEMVKKIGYRKGFGWLLGEGVKRAADEIGGLAHEYAIHVKGQELAAIDPRATYGIAASIATSNRGACHEEGVPATRIERGAVSPDLGYPTRPDRFESEGKGVLAAKAQDFECMLDALVCCNFLFHPEIPFKHIQPSQFAEWLSAVTGWEVGLREFMLIGERIFNLKRMFNVRRGISRKDDLLPGRILMRPTRQGPLIRTLPPIGPLLNEYYAYRGWSEEGVPTRAKLEQLSLEGLTSYLPQNV